MPEYTVEITLRVATAADLNYVVATGPDKESIKVRMGFLFWLKNGENSFKRYVLDERIKKEWMLERLRKELIYVACPDHPDNNLPGVDTKHWKRKSKVKI